MMMNLMSAVVLQILIFLFLFPVAVTVAAVVVVVVAEVVAVVTVVARVQFVAVDREHNVHDRCLILTLKTDVTESNELMLLLMNAVFHDYVSEEKGRSSVE